MSSLSLESFEQYRQKGFEARQAGQWKLARLHLLQAATVMAGLCKQTQNPELRDSRTKVAESLLQLAKDCGKAHDDSRCWQVTEGTDEIERKIIEVVRNWLFTLCHDLCIPVPLVGIADKIPTPYGFDAAGVALHSDVIWFEKVDRSPETYLSILAHELRHRWQHHNRRPATEKDANEYADEALTRLQRPHTKPYSGPIMRCRELTLLVG